MTFVGVNGETMESFHIEENASDVCDMLRNVVHRHSLIFNPNLCEEGVRGTLDPHGLVLVLACGTLHNQHTVCGVFEQVILNWGHEDHMIFIVLRAEVSITERL